ncbi:esterase-like activity of phytase family protein [Gramella sp. GC03-9]|uniref:Esterase-like activity of phytase family protein n=1 Tax=Christiangramia oceanisediminis TaxID=2920386 RepID=A0A9X2KZ67_9FLAO|nr:esterase-like activity of phytase family protein [Gramella oceanisediminis]MCP9201073.1 esterase-like activity of phytase family protein [Gramella oceanisediminis]
MKKILIACLITLILSSCAVSRKVHNNEIEITFLDEYVLPAETDFQDTRVGGLSGIDYSNGSYYLVCDDAGNPRIYTAKIDLQHAKIENIEITEVLEVSRAGLGKHNVLDLEAIRYDSASGNFMLTSEGMINDSKDPGIYQVSQDGNIKMTYSLPDYFKAEGTQKPRNNGVFEGLSESYDGTGYWVATELPLTQDGPKPKLYPTRSHIRVTKFDKQTGEAVKQFAYKLDGIPKLPINYFAINGLTELIEYEENKFLILERAYAAGYSSHGNTVKIFAVDGSEASNTLDMHSLKDGKYQKAEKELVFNFKKFKESLTEGIIDNIEGMSFGPELENGNKTLILVSDNNFNSYDRQLNQFLLLEINFR